MWYDRPMPPGWGNQAEWEWQCYRQRGRLVERDRDAVAAAHTLQILAKGVPPLRADMPRRARRPRRDDELSREIRHAKERRLVMAIRMGLAR